MKQRHKASKPASERQNCTLVMKRGDYRRQRDRIKEAYALSQFEILVKNIEVMRENGIDVRGYNVFVLKAGKQAKVIAQRQF